MKRVGSPSGWRLCSRPAGDTQRVLELGYGHPVFLAQGVKGLARLERTEDVFEPRSSMSEDWLAEAPPWIDDDFGRPVLREVDQLDVAVTGELHPV